jgi:hypothetical protein
MNASDKAARVNMTIEALTISKFSWIVDEGVVGWGRSNE